ncbi:hypothetical protein T02_8435 [Trichinella nativa]|uniref:Uncharacterized protein n=1 Tax=Trichinella nativa TaxID=6335 RepID=A0A0V1LE69_9BILA|nr:hypothetical protein T02_8435 [Trichinella nativa]
MVHPYVTTCTSTWCQRYWEKQFGIRLTQPKRVLLGMEFFDSGDSDIIWEQWFNGTGRNAGFSGSTAIKRRSSFISKLKNCAFLCMTR